MARSNKDRRLEVTKEPNALNYTTATPLALRKNQDFKLPKLRPRRQLTPTTEKRHEAVLGGLAGPVARDVYEAVVAVSAMQEKSAEERTPEFTEQKVAEPTAQQKPFLQEQKNKAYYTLDLLRSAPYKEFGLGAVLNRATKEEITELYNYVNLNCEEDFLLRRLQKDFLGSEVPHIIISGLSLLFDHMLLENEHNLEHYDTDLATDCRRARQELAGEKMITDALYFPHNAKQLEEAKKRFAKAEARPTECNVGSRQRYCVRKFKERTQKLLGLKIPTHNIERIEDILRAHVTFVVQQLHTGTSTHTLGTEQQAILLSKRNRLYRGLGTEVIQLARSLYLQDVLAPVGDKAPEVDRTGQNEDINAVARMRAQYLTPKTLLTQNQTVKDAKLGLKLAKQRKKKLREEVPSTEKVKEIFARYLTKKLRADSREALLLSQQTIEAINRKAQPTEYHLASLEALGWQILHLFEDDLFTVTTITGRSDKDKPQTVAQFKAINAPLDNPTLDTSAVVYFPTLVPEQVSVEPCNAPISNGSTITVSKPEAFHDLPRAIVDMQAVSFFNGMWKETATRAAADDCTYWQYFFCKEDPQDNYKGRRLRLLVKHLTALWEMIETATPEILVVYLQHKLDWRLRHYGTEPVPIQGSVDARFLYSAGRYRNDEASRTGLKAALAEMLGCSKILAPTIKEHAEFFERIPSDSRVVPSQVASELRLKYHYLLTTLEKQTAGAYSTAVVEFDATASGLQITGGLVGSEKLLIASNILRETPADLPFEQWPVSDIYKNLHVAMLGDLDASQVEQTFKRSDAGALLATQTTRDEAKWVRKANFSLRQKIKEQTKKESHKKILQTFEKMLAEEETIVDLKAQELSALFNFCLTKLTRKHVKKILVPKLYGECRTNALKHLKEEIWEDLFKDAAFQWNIQGKEVAINSKTLHPEVFYTLQSRLYARFVDTLIKEYPGVELCYRMLSFIGSKVEDLSWTIHPGVTHTARSNKTKYRQIRVPTPFQGSDGGESEDSARKAIINAVARRTKKQTKLAVGTDDVIEQSAAQRAQAFPPNFTHSVDATIAIEVKKQYHWMLPVVHDAFLSAPNSLHELSSTYQKAYWKTVETARGEMQRLFTLAQKAHKTAAKIKKAKSKTQSIEPSAEEQKVQKEKHTALEKKYKELTSARAEVTKVKTTLLERQKTLEIEARMKDNLDLSQLERIRGAVKAKHLAGVNKRLELATERWKALNEKCSTVDKELKEVSGVAAKEKQKAVLVAKAAKEPHKLTHDDLSELPFPKALTSTKPWGLALFL